MRLFLIRHGETNWNREGRFQGQRDTALSEKGREQARRVAAYLSRHKFDVIAASPLSRALNTAEEISLRNSQISGRRKTEIIGEFTEINHGDWEGLLAAEVRERWGDLLERWHTAPETVKMPGAGGESLEDVRKRAVAGVEQIGGKYAGDVAVVSHDAVIKVLLCDFLGAPAANFWRFRIANCSLSVIELEGGQPPRVSLLGDAHYLGDGFERTEQKAL